MEGAHFSRRRGTHATGAIRARTAWSQRNPARAKDLKEAQSIAHARHPLQKKRLSNRRAPRGSARSSPLRLEARVGVRPSRACSHSFKSNSSVYVPPSFSLFPPEFLRAAERVSHHSLPYRTVPVAIRTSSATYPTVSLVVRPWVRRWRRGRPEERGAANGAQAPSCVSRRSTVREVPGSSSDHGTTPTARLMRKKKRERRGTNGGT